MCQIKASLHQNVTKHTRPTANHGYISTNEAKPCPPNRLTRVKNEKIRRQCRALLRENYTLPLKQTFESHVCVKTRNNQIPETSHGVNSAISSCNSKIQELPPLADDPFHIDKKTYSGTQFHALLSASIVYSLAHSIPQETRQPPTPASPLTLSINHRTSATVCFQPTETDSTRLSGASPGNANGVTLAPSLVNVIR